MLHRQPRLLSPQFVGSSRLPSNKKTYTYTSILMDNCSVPRLDWKWQLATEIFHPAMTRSTAKNSWWSLISIYHLHYSTNMTECHCVLSLWGYYYILGSWKQTVIGIRWVRLLIRWRCFSCAARLCSLPQWQPSVSVDSHRAPARTRCELAVHRRHWGDYYHLF